MSDKLRVLILANNEADVLGCTLDHLISHLGDPALVDVVADQCVDSTAEIALQRGVNVHVRAHQGVSSKGHALRWWARKTGAGTTPNEYIVVLDADSHVSEGFFSQIRDAISSGHRVYQTRVEPDLKVDNPISLFAGLSEITEHVFFDKYRSKLGWPVRLRGTGMVIQRSVLNTYLDSLTTMIEDSELTITLSAAGIPIQYIHEAKVFDPKPDSKEAAVNQRARWLKGQVQLLRSKPLQLAKLVLKGLPAWSLLFSLLGKPRSLILPGKFLLMIFAGIMTRLAPTANWLWIPVSSAIFLEFVVLMIAMSLAFRSLDQKVNVVRAIVFIPYFVLIWIGSVALALTSSDPWLRSRPLSMKPIIHKTGRPQIETR